MVSRLNDCDRHRLRLSLEDRLSEAEQSELADHLEICQACGQELERMAAASQLWGDARLLRGEPESGYVTHGGTVSRGRQGARGRRSSPASGTAFGSNFSTRPHPDRPESAGPARAVRGDRGFGPGRDGRGAQGARPGAGSNRGDQGAHTRPGARRDGPPPVRTRGPGSGGGRPRAHRGDSCG